ncbi:MAG TPA: 50S ribosomal protein L23 [Rhodothermales bacterium]|nr:50S ribosomal protein L23 [Rhodothermales bacterium]
MKDAHKVLIKPLVTEKMSRQMADGHYAFVVDMEANKIDVRKAVEALYPAIKVKEVRTMVVRGKRRRQFSRKGVVEGRTAWFKKAIVTLAPGSEQIDFFETV